MVDTRNLSNEHKLKLRITEIMREIGIPANLKGYFYVRDAIIMALKEPKLLKTLTTRLYPKVAEKYDTTPSRVERAIRHAIEKAWDCGDVSVLNSYFGYATQRERGKPTNGQFLSTIVDFIQLEME